ncbi:MAG: hypothetical protein ACTSVO_05545 [Candidatus Heimdallarchaeaceae archaeon]
MNGQKLNDVLRPEWKKIIVTITLFFLGFLGSFCFLRIGSRKPYSFDYEIGGAFPLCLIGSIPFWPIIIFDLILPNGLIVDENFYLLVLIISVPFSYAFSCLVVWILDRLT